jgi:hypothetical protein
MYILKRFFLFPVLLLLVFTAGTVRAGVVSLTLGVPNSMTVCGNPQTFTATLTANNAGYNQFTVNMSLFNGVLHTGAATGLYKAGGNGAGTTVNVAVGNAGTGNPTFSVNQLMNPGDVIVITFQAAANCHVIPPYVQGQSAQAITGRNTATVTATSSTSQVSDPPLESSPYSILAAELVINLPVSNTVSKMRGEVVTRSVPVRNSGVGSLNEFKFKITHDIRYSDLKVVKVGLATLSNPAVVTNGHLKTYIFTVSGSFAGGTFDQGETITIDESTEITGCAEFIHTTYDLEWGCPPKSCSDDPSRRNNITYVATIDRPDQHADIWSTLTILNETDFCQKNTVGRYEWKFKNVGANSQTTDGKDVAGNIYFYLGYLQNVSISKIWVIRNSVAYNLTSYINGNLLDLDNLTTNIDGPGGLEDIDKDGGFDDIADQDSIIIRVEYSMFCPNAFSRANTSILFDANVSMVYDRDICDPNKGSYSVAHYHSSLRKNIQLNKGTVAGPSDVVDNTVYTYTYSPNITVPEDGLYNCTTNEFTLKVTLPAGFQYVAGTAQTPLTSPFISQSGNILTIRGNASSFTAGLSNYRFNLQFSCAGGITSGAANLLYELSHKCNSTCSCVQRLDSVYKAVYKHCTVAGGPGCGIRTSSFSVVRTTMGFVPLSGAPANYYTVGEFKNLRRTTLSTPNIRLKAGYELDSVRMIARGRISGCTFTDVRIRISYPAPMDLFDFRGGTYKIGTSIVNITTPPSVSFNAGVVVYEFTVPATSGITDTVNVTAFFTVKRLATTFPKQFDIPDIRAEHRGKNASDPGYTGGESFGDIFTIFKPRLNSYVYYFTSDTCGIYPYYQFNLDGTGNEFPNEFRPVTHITSIINRLPSGYTFRPGYFSYYGNSRSLSLSNFTPVQSGNDLIFNLGDNALMMKVFTSNQNDNYTALFYEVTSSCNNTAPVEPYTVNYTRHDYSGFCTLTGVRNSYCDEALNGNITYHNPSPSYSFQGDGNKAGVTKNVTWKVTLTEYSYGYAQNNWISFGNHLSNTTKIKLTGAYYKALVNGQLVNRPLTIQNFSDGISDLSKGIKLIQVGPFSGMRDVFLDAEYEVCTPGVTDTVNILTGFFCNGYPSDINRADDCGTIRRDKLSLTIKTANMDWKVKETSTGPYDACNGEVRYRLTFFSTGLADMNNVGLWTNIDKLGSVSVTSATCTYYPVPGTPTASTLTVPPQAFQDGRGWTIPLPGSKFSPGDSIVVNLTFRLACGVDAGKALVIKGHGFTNCGDRVLLDGSRPPFNILNLVNAVDTLEISLNSPGFNKKGGNTTVYATVFNKGKLSTKSGSRLVITIPSTLTYLASSPGVTSTQVLGNGQRELVWVLSPAIPGGAMANFTFTVMDNTASNYAGSVHIDAMTYNQRQVVCSNGANCEVRSTSSTGELDIPIVQEPCCGPQIPCSDCITSFAPEPGKKYILSAWVKEPLNESAITYTNPSIRLYFEGPQFFSPFYKAKGEIIDGWQRISEEFVVPLNSTEIKVILGNGALNADVLFDDIRIHPFNGNMKSFVYDPVSLKLVAELDENNYASFYEYDEEGSLIRVKKETRKGIQTIKESRNNTRKK